MKSNEQIIAELRGQVGGLSKENDELKSLLREAADYLDTNKLTSISSRSVFHKQFREACAREN